MKLNLPKKWFKKMAHEGNGEIGAGHPSHTLKRESIATTIPKGWFVFEMGQSLAHMLWFCNILESFPVEGLRRQVFVEEFDTPEEALHAAIVKVRRGGWIYPPAAEETGQQIESCESSDKMHALRKMKYYLENQEEVYTTQVGYIIHTILDLYKKLGDLEKSKNKQE